VNAALAGAPRRHRCIHRLTRYQQKFGDCRCRDEWAPTAVPTRRAATIRTAKHAGSGASDANGDGQISRNEWRGNAQSFQNFDWNSDGVLAGNEVSPGGRNTDEARNDNMSNDDRFGYLDINGNGFVDRNEWDGGYSVFSRLDVNRDNKLTRDEWENTARSANFAGVDLNRDGRIAL
jgi:Ca2+-binding EF-hand superfamily protein